MPSSGNWGCGFTPAAARIVAVQAIVMIGCPVDPPEGITPGHRIEAGTLIPQSKWEAENIVN